MKNLPLIFVAAVVALAVACNAPASESTSSTDTTAASAPEVVTVNVITWIEIGLRDMPDEKGKYLTSAYIGEQFELTGDTAATAVNGKTQKYHKIKLSDGKTGWVRDEFLGIHVYPAAILVNTAILKRPDVTTVTDKTFNMADFIVVKSKHGDFVEVTGKIAGETWYSSGYISSKDVSYDNLDVRFAALHQRMNDQKEGDLKTKLMVQVASEEIFGASKLYQTFYNPAEEEVDESYEEEDPGLGIMQMQLMPPKDGLLAHYNMDHAAVEDKSGHQPDGKSVDVGFDHDKGGSAMAAWTFNGTSSYVTIPEWSGEPLKPPFTIVAYIRLQDYRQLNQTIASKGRSDVGTGFNFGYTVKDNGVKVFYLGMIGAEKPIAVEARTNVDIGVWTFVAASFDMQTMKIYVDGKLAATTAVSQYDAQEMLSNLGDSDQPLEIGRELESLGRYFYGSIDNLAIWNRALSDDEIAEMYH